MRGRLSLFTFAAAVVAILAGLPVGASADDAERVVIGIRASATGPSTLAGTFTAAGGVSDSGTLSSTITAVTPEPSGEVRVETTDTLTGSLGTLTLETVASGGPVTAPRRFFRGTWRIVGGTGAYADLRGKGKAIAVGDFTTAPPSFTAVRDGKVRNGAN